MTYKFSQVLGISLLPEVSLPEILIHLLYIKDHVNELTECFPVCVDRQSSEPNLWPALANVLGHTVSILGQSLTYSFFSLFLSSCCLP